MPSKITHWLQIGKDRWMLWLPVGLGLGSGLYFSLPAEPPLWLAVIAPLFGLGLLLIGRRHRWLRLLALLVCVLGCGFAAGWMKTQRMDAPVLARKIMSTQVEGVIAGVVAMEKGSKITLSRLQIEGLKPEETPRRITLNVRQKDAALLTGQHVRIRAGLFPPPMPSYPGAYDFLRHFYFEGIGATGYSQKTPEIIQAPEGESGWSMFWATNRTLLTEQFHQAMTPPYGPLATALVTGDDRAIPESIKQEMRDAGLYHILAVSGMNLAIVATILFFLIRYPLVLIPGLAVRMSVKKLAAFAALMGTIAYLMIAGAPLSAQRACVMVGLILLAVMVDRQNTAMRALAWAATVLLIIEPEAIYAPSFQLSFAATLALIAFYEYFKGPYGRWHRMANWWQKILLYILSVALSTLVAGMATAPFAIFHFHRFAIYSLLANMLVIPAVSFWLMPFALLALALMPLGMESLALIPLQWGIQYMLYVAHAVATLPQASLFVPPLTGWGLLTLSLGGLWLCVWQTRRRWLGIPFIIAGMLSTLFYDAPDIFISKEANALAVRDADGNLVSVAGGSRNFLVKGWLSDFGQTKMLTRKEAHWNEEVSLACDSDGCFYRKNGKRIALVSTRQGIYEDCGEADVLVTLHFDARDICGGQRMVDGGDVWWGGTHTLWIKPNEVRIESVVSGLSDRPWHSINRRR